MAMAVRSFLFLIVVSLSTGVVADDTTELRFLSELRNRRYFDTAIEYISRLETQSSLGPEAKAVLDYEKGLTLIAYASQLPDLESRNTILDQAQAALEKFVTAQPQHPLVAKANAEQANIFFARARTLTLQSRSPANAGKKQELQDQARKVVAQAKATFDRAYNQYETKWKSFPTFIDEGDKEKVAARKEAENGYLTAKLNLARCSYEQGQTYDEKSKKRIEVLTSASKEFETIHTAHRSQFVGLYARMMQGKCFEEQDDLKRALGIYNELLGHTGTSSTLVRIKDQVQRFRLICLNHEEKNDHELAVVEATNWLTSHSNRQRDPNGLGIRWEMARAQEKLGQNPDATDVLRERYIRQSLDNARIINKQPGELKDVSAAMIRRLKVALGQKESEPDDFDTAFELARSMIRQIKPFKQKVQGAKGKPAKAAAREDLKIHLNETVRYLQLALQLADDSTEVGQAMQARYLASFVYYELQRSYDSIVLAKYVMRFSPPEDSETAMNAADVALAASVQAFNSAKSSDNAMEIQLMESVANEIITRWEQSPRGNDARMQLGRLFAMRKEPLKAAEWFVAIPQSAPQYGDARMAAGQAYWAAYLTASAGQATTPEEDINQDELKSMRQQAETLLQSGIKIAEDRVPADGKPGETTTAAKTSLAQILNQTARYDATIEVLTAGAHPVVKAIAVEGARPATGVRSAEFASLCYQLLLRAYVGKQQIDDALKAMEQMEAVGGSDNTQVYVELGQELEKEIERLKNSGETEQLAEVRGSFEKFLNELFQRKEGQAYNSLIWIAETYYSLGQGMDDKNAATGYYSKAASAYDDIISRKLIEGNGLAGVKLRLANCRRAQGEYDQSLALVNEMLTENVNSLPAQFEAANILQSWGSNGRPEALIEAINGKLVGGEKQIWGWAAIAQRLSAVQASGRGSDDVEQKYLDANYNAFDSRRQYGLTQSGDGKKKALESARQEIEVFVALAGELEPETWSRFDSLYRQIQADDGIRPQDPLKKPEVIKTPTIVAQQSGDQDEQAAGVATVGAATEVAPVVVEQTAPNYILIGLAFLVAAGVGIGAFFMMSKPKKRPAYARAAPTTFKGVGAVAARPAEPTFPTPAAATKKRTRPPGEKGAAPRKQTKKTATGAPIAKKRRPPAVDAEGQPQKRRVPKKRPAADPAGTGQAAPKAKKRVRKVAPNSDQTQPVKKKRKVRPPQPPQEEA